MSITIKEFIESIESEDNFKHPFNGESYYEFVYAGRRYSCVITTIEKSRTQFVYHIKRYGEDKRFVRFTGNENIEGLDDGLKYQEELDKRKACTSQCEVNDTLNGILEEHIMTPDRQRRLEGEAWTKKNILNALEHLTNITSRTLSILEYHDDNVSLWLASARDNIKEANEREGFE